jgi:hypothetical protein
MLIYNQFTHRPMRREKDVTSSVRKLARGAMLPSRISILFSDVKSALESSWILLQEYWCLRMCPDIAAKSSQEVIFIILDGIFRRSGLGAMRKLLDFIDFGNIGVKFWVY